MFKKLKKNVSLPIGIGSTSQSQLNDSSTYINRDVKPSSQSPLLFYIDRNNPKHRWIQVKANSNGSKLTFGLANRLFSQPPKYFKYVDPQSDFKESVELKSMDYVHRLWQKEGMYKVCKDAFAQGEGVNTSFIVRLPAKDGFRYMVLNTSHLKDGDSFYRDPITNEIIEADLIIPSEGKGKIKGSDTSADIPEIRAIKGVNAVFFTPNPSSDDPWGLSDILASWDSIILRYENKYYSVVFSKKGGIGSRVLLAPDSIQDRWKNRFEMEAQKGLESDLISMYYPSQMANNDKVKPSEIVQWIENQAGSVDFEKTDNILSKDSPFPKQFTESVEGGALGGQAPIEENKTINKILMGYVGAMNTLIKDINNTFFGITQKNYMAIPYLLEEESAVEKAINQGENPLGQKNEDKTTDSEPKSDNTQTKSDKSNNSRTMQCNGQVVFKRHSVQNNAVGEEEVVYVGNLWQSGKYQYEGWDGEPEYEYLDGDAITEYVLNVMKTHEHYLSIDHPYQVTYQNAIGILRVRSYEVQNGITKDITDITFKKEFDPKMDEIKLSPSYYCSHEYKNGEIYQTDLDLLAAGMTFYPRSELTGMNTTAKKK